MSTPDDVFPLPDPGDRPLVVVVDAPSTIERRIVDRWLAEHDPPAADDRRAETVPSGSQQLAARLTRGDNPLLVPVRVVWAPEPEPQRKVARVVDTLTRGSA